MPKKRVFRQFLYLDADLLRTFLDQLPQGTTRAVRTERQSQRGSSLGGGAELGPVGLRAGRDKGLTETTEYEVRSSSFADFQAFRQALDSPAPMERLEAMNEEAWGQLQVGEILELAAVLRQPQISIVIQAGGRVRSILEMAQAFDPAIDPATVEMLTKLEALNGVVSTSTLPVIMSIVGSRRFQFTTELIDGALQVPVTELAGEATVLGTLQKKIPKGQSATTVDLGQTLPQVLENRETRRRSKQAAPSNSDFPREMELEIPYPVAVMKTLAIYR